MDAEVRRLLILLLFQFSLYITLETMSRDECRILVWQWQQLCSMTLALQNYRRIHGSRPRRHRSSKKTKQIEKSLAICRKGKKQKK